MSSTTTTTTPVTTRRTALGLAGALVLAAGATSACSGGTFAGSPLGPHCGLGTGKRDVAPTIQCFAHAVIRQDATQSCALLTRDARAKAAKTAPGSGPHTCVAATERAFALINDTSADRAEVKHVLTRLHVSGVSVGSASAIITEPKDAGGDFAPVLLRVEDGGWRLENATVNAS